MSDWRVDVLRELNAPVTAANLNFLAGWQAREGGHTANKARWNWLNTTSGSQYPAINSVGVRAFPDYRTGVRMTATTIRNGRYPAILEGLRNGDPYSAPGVEGDLSTWVSGSRTGGLDYAASVLGRAVDAVQETAAAAVGQAEAAGCGTAVVGALLAAAWSVHLIGGWWW